MHTWHPLLLFLLVAWRHGRRLTLTLTLSRTNSLTHTLSLTHSLTHSLIPHARAAECVWCLSFRVESDGVVSEAAAINLESGRIDVGCLPFRVYGRAVPRLRYRHEHALLATGRSGPVCYGHGYGGGGAGCGSVWRRKRDGGEGAAAVPHAEAAMACLKAVAVQDGRK